MSDQPGNADEKRILDLYAKLHALLVDEATADPEISTIVSVTAVVGLACELALGGGEQQAQRKQMLIDVVEGMWEAGVRALGIPGEKGPTARGIATCANKHSWPVALYPYTFGMRGTPPACPTCNEHYTGLAGPAGLDFVTTKAAGDGD